MFCRTSVNIDYIIVVQMSNSTDMSCVLAEILEAKHRKHKRQHYIFKRCLSKFYCYLQTSNLLPIYFLRPGRSKDDVTAEIQLAYCLGWYQNYFRSHESKLPLCKSVLVSKLKYSWMLISVPLFILNIFVSPDFLSIFPVISLSRLICCQLVFLLSFIAWAVD